MYIKLHVIKGPTNDNVGVCFHLGRKTNNIHDGNIKLTRGDKKATTTSGTVGDNNQLVTIPSILFKNAKFVSQCHVFGSKVLLYALTACCDQHQLNFDAWPNIFKQQFYVQCMNYDATSKTKFHPILVTAREVIKLRFTFTGSTRFDGSSYILDLHSRSLMTTVKNHLKENFHRVLKRDIRLLMNIHLSSLSKSRRNKIARQVFCAIVGLFNKKEIGEWF